MQLDKFTILIPARYESSRFLGKPLATILGESMISRVYRNCESSGAKVYVVTDDSRIENHVLDFEGNVLRIDDDVKSGSERVFLAYERFLREKGYEYVINVQGDEPLLDGSELNRLFDFHKDSKFDITTIVKRKKIDSDFTNPDRVKAAFSKATGKCHYFSRASIPFHQEVTDSNEGHWFLHIGVYCYKVDKLEQFFRSGKSYFENCEKLEQLRALDNNMSIGAIETKLDLMGVDVPEDIKKLEGVLKGEKRS